MSGLEEGHDGVLLPDGPLWQLPLALLPGPAGAPLVEKHPISIVSSATVLAELVVDRRERSISVVAMGDPLYPEGEILLRGGHTRLPPLPSTRREVTSIAQVFGSAAELHLGAEANESAVKAIGRSREGGPSIVHLAAHGLIDERFPLESGVALTIETDYDPTAEAPGENGILQAWEVFESVRLGADLVVLSACETALGKEQAGEGIIGLTRAFQFAGARSVVASLWSVGDESTAELMTRFYSNLAKGQPKDEALRQAQLAFVTGPIVIGEGEDAVERDLGRPFYWAAFQLYGDWR